MVMAPRPEPASVSVMVPAGLLFFVSAPGTIRVTLVGAVTGPVIEKLWPFQTVAVV